MDIGSREWHARRARSGGSSELATLLDCSPFAGSSPLSLAWQKRGLIDAAVDTDSEMRLVWDELEAVGRKWLAHTLQCIVNKLPERDDFVTRCTDCGELCSYPGYHDMVPPLPADACECCDSCLNGLAIHLHANLDGRVLYESRELAYEGKSTSWNNPDYDKWKRNGVPKSVAWQVQQALYCSGLPAALIVVFDMTNAKFSTRVIEADERKQAFLVAAWRTWWQRAVFDGIDPAHDWSDSVATAIKQRWPAVTDEERLLDDEQSAIIESWVAAKDNATIYKKLAKERRTETLKMMESVARITTTTGAYVVRSKSTKGVILLRHYEGTTT